MRTYERNGVHVDQCSECRGIFLDRGELERLMDAEASWNASASPPAAAPAQPPHQPAQPYQPAQSGHSQAQPTGQAASLAAVAGEVLRQVRSSSSSSHGSPYGQKSQYGYKQKSHKKSFLNELFG